MFGSDGRAVVNSCTRLPALSAYTSNVFALKIPQNSTFEFGSSPPPIRSNVRPVRQRHSTPSTGGNSGGLSVGISGPTNRTLRREGSSVTVIGGCPVKLV